MRLVLDSNSHVVKLPEGRMLRSGRSVQPPDCRSCGEDGPTARAGLSMEASNKKRVPVRNTPTPRAFNPKPLNPPRVSPKPITLNPRV